MADQDLMAPFSVVQGEPLSTERVLSSLTIPGYLREITARFGPREALVLHTKDEHVRWTYGTLWERSVELARALVAVGVGKDSRVGVLMSNRPEFVAAAFGIALAGAPHETLGEVVVACLVPHEQAVLEEPAIREFLKARLASYKVPRHLLFFSEEEIAKTGSDKIKAEALVLRATQKLEAFRACNR